MKENNKPYATHEDWQLLKKLYTDPNCYMEDIHGNIAAPWQQDLCRQMLKLKESRKWKAIPFEINGKYGLWNQFDNILCVPPIYDSIGDIPEIDIYDSEHTISNPIPVSKDGKWGMVSSDGKNTTVLPFEYQEITYIGNPKIAIKLKQYEKCGLIYLPLEEREPMFPCIADDILYNDTIRRFVYAKKDKLGLVGVTEAIFDSFRLFDDRNESIVAVKDGQEGFLNLGGEFIAMDSVFLPPEDKRIGIYTIVQKEFELLKVRECDEE